MNPDITVENIEKTRLKRTDNAMWVYEMLSSGDYSFVSVVGVPTGDGKCADLWSVLNSY